MHVSSHDGRAHFGYQNLNDIFKSIGKTNEFFIIFGDKNYPHINWNDLTINENGTSQEDFYCKELETQV